MAAKIIMRPKTPVRVATNSVARSREKFAMDPVEVFCRIRPITDPSVEICVKKFEEDKLILNQPLNSVKTVTYPNQEEVKVTQAQFTHVFDQNACQKQVFDAVALHLCKDLIEGKNGLLFTYGVTGSGKTYTMTGCPTDIGLLPRCLDVIFNSIGDYQAGSCVFVPDKRNGFDVRTESAAAIERARSNLCPPKNIRPGMTPNAKKAVDNDWVVGPRIKESEKVSNVDEDNAYAVFVSFVEIYNNFVYDLLDPPAAGEKPKTKKLCDDADGNRYVEDVIEVEVKDTDQAFEVLMKGQKQRSNAATILNSDSSRSHGVFNIRLVQAPLDETGLEVIQDKTKIHVSQLSLVDLAGSERSSRTEHVGKRMQETGHINQSLMWLRQCIYQLRENQKNNINALIPYRVSTLTYLFKNYFDGEGKVRMVVCMNPSAGDYGENLQVVKFGEATQEVVVPRSIAVEYDGDVLTPGRRRAAQIIQEVKEQLEHDIATAGSNYSSSAVLPKPPTFSLFFDQMPSIDFKSSDDEAILSRLRQHYDSQFKRRHELIAEASVKQTNFEESLRKYIIDHESLKKRHAECDAHLESVENENRRLKSDNRQIRQQLQNAESQLSKFQRDARFLQTQEEALKKREREMAYRVRLKDDKLRAVKEIFDRPAATPNGSDENVGRFGVNKTGPRIAAPLISVSGLYPNLPSITPMKKRAPSPPPKPWRKDQPAYNTRHHRRSQSVEGLGKGHVSQYCPGRRVHLKSEVKLMYCRNNILAYCSKAEGLSSTSDVNNNNEKSTNCRRAAATPMRMEEKENRMMTPTKVLRNEAAACRKKRKFENVVHKVQCVLM